MTIRLPPKDDLLLLLIRWPPPLDLSWGQAENPFWSGKCSTYAEWSSKAASWLARAFLVPLVNKTACHVDPFRAPKNRVDLVYNAISAAQRALDHARRVKKISHAQLTVLSRKLLHLGLSSLDWKEAGAALDTLLSDHVENLSRNAIKRWKERVSFWTLQSKELYAFIRNDPAAKASAIVYPGRLTVNFFEIHLSLVEFWGSLEKWPSARHRDDALMRLSDHYCVFLPHMKAEVVSDHKVLAAIVKEARRASAGPDGWTIAEMKALPKEAWRSLLEVLDKGWHALASTLLLTYKRVPIEKGCSHMPLPSDMRPIDVYSTIMRAVARMHTTSFTQWKKHVSHAVEEARHSLGATVCSWRNRTALARLTCIVERIRRKMGKWWCVTLDFSKLYNMIDSWVVRLFKKPSLSSVFLRDPPPSCWSPFVCPRATGGYPMGLTAQHTFMIEGHPQGLSTSALASEAFVSILCWKISRSTNTQIIGCVYDITLASDHLPEFRKSLDILKSFLMDFCFTVNAMKSSLWGSDEPSL